MASIETNNNGEVKIRPLRTVLPNHTAPVCISRPTAQEEGLFTYLSRLPLELRDRIWESCGHEARIILLFVSSKDGEALLTFLYYSGSPYFTGVNAESRRAVLRAYKPLTNDRQMFVNLSQDVFQSPT